MPKTVFSKREDFICGKVDDLVIDIKILDITDELKEYLITKIYNIQHDAQRMENKKQKNLKQKFVGLTAMFCKVTYNVPQLHEVWEKVRLNFRFRYELPNTN